MHVPSHCPSSTTRPRTRQRTAGTRTWFGRLVRPAAVGALLLATICVPALAAARPTANLDGRIAASEASRQHRRHPLPAPGAALRDAARTADGPSRAPVTLTVGGLSFQWRTLPETAVTVELRAGAVVKASADALSDARGRVAVQLDAAGDGAAMQAGDEVRFKADGLDEVFHVAVPELAADVDAAANAIIGRAPAGTTVTAAVRLRSNAALDYFGTMVDGSAEDGGTRVPPSIERRAIAGPDGVVRIDLTGDADVRPGDVAALTLQDGAGDTFVALGAATQVLLAPDRDWAMATATLGTTVTLTVLAPDGATRVVLRGRTYESGPGSQLPQAYLWAEEEEEDELPTPENGDALVLTRSDGLVPQGVTTATLPALAIDDLDRAGTVRGSGPAGSSLAARLFGPFGETSDLALAPGPDGVFAARAAAALGPGWRAVLVWSDPGGVATGVVGVVPQVRARVGAASVGGIGWPGRLVTVTLRSAGARVGTWSDVAGSNGQFRIPLVDRRPDGSTTGAPRRLAPGTSIEVEFDDGDPVIVGITDLRTSTDPDGETVSGAAPPGADLTWTLMRPRIIDEAGDAYDYRLVRRLDVKAGLDGRWSIDVAEFAGPDGKPIDIEPPDWGEVVLVRPDGHFLMRAWAPIRIDAALGHGFASGHGPPGEDMRLTLTDASGQRLVERRIDAEATPWGDETPLWFAAVADPLGKEVPTAPGDTLTVTIGDTTESLVFPSVEAASHVGDDRVTGRTRPDAPIDLDVWTPRGDNVHRTAIADVDGAFSFVVAPEIDLVYNASVSLTVHVGRHRVWHGVDVPGLTVDLDTGGVYGSAEPDLPVTLTLERAGRTIRRRQIATDPYGTFEASLVGADPAVDRPIPGDVIVLSAPGAHFIEPRVTMAVPELTVDLPPERDHLAGRFDAAGSLAVEFWSEGPSATSPDVTHLVTGADGRWRLDWSNDAFRLAGGWMAHAQLLQPSGHMAVRNRHVPRFDVRLGGARTCGYALPHAPVRLTAAGPSGVGSAGARSGGDGGFHADVVGAGGAARPIQAGDVLAADLGGWPATLTVPGIDLTVDWTHGVLTGTTTPSATLMLAAWQGDCTADGDGGISWSDWYGFADATGRFHTPIPDPRSWWDVDRRFAVVVVTPDGHRVYRPLAAVGIRARPDIATASGVALPGAPYTATLQAPDGRVRATASGTVTSDGTWDLAFVANGLPVAMRDGDRLSVGAAGSVASIVIETLAFDFDVVRGLMGTARPKRSVEVVLGLHAPGGAEPRSEWYDLTSDAAGAFAIAAPPPRARWTMADVRSIRATVRLTEGHTLESRLDLAPPPPAPLYLPVAHRR